ncbi:transcriptional regulator, TetR family [Klenkia soli]|uniref:Transcriptional regulator, TetR family n=1 Tax=Klenkia soli TaxID=1052260 RepID=A0A1H0R639_9ACTN|nr:transcriptional regulator, TetR family [Klenkia soli]
MPALPRPVGRPRDPALDVAILAAALELLGEGGMETCALDAVARRAGVGKATIYRRWPSKDDLVRDAFGSTAPELLPAEDQGSLVGDAVGVLAALAAALRAPRARAWRRTVPALGPDSPLLPGLPTGPVGDWTGAVDGVVARAEQRGEVGPGTFPPLALRAACAVLVERWLTGQDLDEATETALLTELQSVLLRPHLRG